MSKDPELLKNLKGHKNNILTAKFSPNGQNVVSAGLENSIFFHKLNNFNFHYKIFAHDDVIYSLDYGEHENTKSQFFLSASRDKTVKLWSLDNLINQQIEDQEFEPIIYRCHNNTIRFVNISPLNNSIFCTGSDDKTIKIWSTNIPNKRLNTFTSHTNWIRCCKFSKKNENLIASCGDDSTLRLFDLRSNGKKGSILKTITTAKNRHFTYLDWFPLSENFISIASNNNMIRVFDIRNMVKLIQFYKPFSDSVNCIEFHPNGQYLLCCSSDATSKLIDVVEGRLLYTLKGHFKPIFNCTFNCDGSKFLTAGADKAMKLWKSNLKSFDSINKVYSSDNLNDQENINDNLSDTSNDNQLLTQHLIQTYSNKKNKIDLEQNIHRNSFLERNLNSQNTINQNNLDNELEFESIIHEKNFENIEDKNDLKKIKTIKEHNLVFNKRKINQNDFEYLDDIFNHLNLLENSLTKLEKRLTKLENKLN